VQASGRHIQTQTGYIMGDCIAHYTPYHHLFEMMQPSCEFELKML